MISIPLKRPVPGAINSVYGLRRFFNKKPKSPHRGLDFRGKRGTPVKACASGKVILVGNHFFAGKSVYVDHGSGIISCYFHLNSIRTQTNQKLSKGDVLGTIGSSGRVTGPHLHLGFYILGHAIDPAPLFSKKFL